VNELICPITGQWDEQLVRDNFWKIDADVILATPIREDFEDFYAWHYDSVREHSLLNMCINCMSKTEMLHNSALRKMVMCSNGRRYGN
jgi:hypothetical protein